MTSDLERAQAAEDEAIAAEERAIAARERRIAARAKANDSSPAEQAWVEARLARVAVLEARKALHEAEARELAACDLALELTAKERAMQQTEELLALAADSARTVAAEASNLVATVAVRTWEMRDER